MIAVMNIPKMEVAPASAAAAAEAVPEHMGALSVGNDYGYGKVEDVREQHAKELQRDKKSSAAPECKCKGACTQRRSSS